PPLVATCCCTRADTSSSGGISAAVWRSSVPSRRSNSLSGMVGLPLRGGATRHLCQQPDIALANHALQRGQSGVHAPSRRAAGAAKDAGQLLVGAAGIVAEHDCFPLLLCERAERLQQRGARFYRLGVLRGIPRPAARRHGIRLTRLRRLLLEA